MPGVKIRIQKREFLRGYGTGIDDMKGMDVINIVRVVNGDLEMSKLAYYHHHGKDDVSNTYIKGWARAIKDVYKGVGEGAKMMRRSRYR